MTNLIRSGNNYTVREEVIRDIKEQIVTGELPIDQELEINDLSSEATNSTQLIQEALAIMAREGVLILPSVSTFKIRKITPDETRDLIKTRLWLEKSVVSELAKTIDDQKLSILLKNLKQMQASRKAGDRGLFIKQAFEFHSKMAELAGFKFASDFLENLQYKMRVLGLQSITEEKELNKAKMAAILREHGNIIKALEAHQPKKAERTIVSHLRLTSKRLLPNVRFSE